MMKKLTLLLLVATGTVSAATFNLFTPASGVLKGNPNTYVTTSATSTDVKSLWTGTCNNSTYLRGDGTCATPPGTGGGTVNSVGLSAPSVFSVTGSPVTNSGTLALSFATGQTANQVLASPNGSTGALSLRSLVAADIPTLDLSTKTTTTLTGLLLGSGSGAPSAYTGTSCTNQFPRSLSVSGAATCASVNLASDITGIAAAANGGTGNGFTAFTGPTTSTKTFTLPNASATILTSNAAVTVAQGGTGVATLTGIAKGNGTSAFTTAVSSDVRSLWGGTCDATTYLRGDGSCATPATGGTSANPSATIGLTAVNGAAGTFMRSDAAPALSQAIAPTWTGQHYFKGNVTADTAQTYSAIGTSSSGTIAYSQQVVSGAAVNSRVWDTYFDTSGNSVSRAVNDAGNSAGIWQQVHRSGAAITGIEFGNATNNPTYSFLGTGASTFNGSVTVNAPSSGSNALNVTGTAGGRIAHLVSGTSGSSASEDLTVYRAGSTANNIQQGPNLTLFDSAATTASTLQQSGGQTELWQYNGGWNQVLKVDTNRRVTINAPSSGNALTVFGGIEVAASTFTGTGAGIWMPSVNALGLVAGGNNRITVASAGNVTIAAPSSGTTLSVSAASAGDPAIDLASGTLAIAGSEGTSGQVLTSNGSGAAPSWTTPAGSCTTGSFTGSFTGMTTTPSATISYRVCGNIATLWQGGFSNITGTSNANTMTMTGLPAAVRPSTQHFFNCTMIDNGNTGISGQCLITGGSSTIIFEPNKVVGSFVQFNSSGFTASGTKGIEPAWAVSYPLD